MTTHSRLSPSSRHRWSRCPGSVKLCQDIPSTRGPSSIDGTHSHTLLERCINNDLRDPTFYLGKEMADHEGSFVVDEERALRVRVVIDYLAKRRLEAILAGQKVSVLAEVRVTLASLLGGRTDLDGTADAILITGDTLEIVDLKDGRNRVEAKHNDQLEVYALGAYASVPMGDIRTVRMTIVQPRLLEQRSNPVSSWEVSIESLLQRLPQLVAEADAASEDSAPLVPGDKQCKYCPASGNCSARVRSLFTNIGLDI